MQKYISLIGSALITLTLVACGGDSSAPLVDDGEDLGGGAVDNPTTNPPVAGSAFEELQAMPENSLFVQALTKGGVHHQTAGAGDYTFFAPTNTAIENWAAGKGITVDELLEDNNLMYRAMKYHIFAGATRSTDFDFGRPLLSVRKDVFKTEFRDPGGLELFDGFGNNIKSVQVDIEATNGIVHVIDRVMEFTDNTVGSLLEARSDLTLFTKIVQTAGLIETFKFQTDDPTNRFFQGFTVLAPNDDAVSAYLGEVGISEQDLLADTTLMQAIIGYHSLRTGNLFYRDLPSGPNVPTNNGAAQLQIDANSRVLTDVRGRTANIVNPDTFSKNGVIHVIDKVMIWTP